MKNEPKLQDEIRAAWERYHGPVNDIYGDPIPQAPPAYSRGYLDGYAEAENAIQELIAEIESIKSAAGSTGKTTIETIADIRDLVIERDDLERLNERLRKLPPESD